MKSFRVLAFNRILSLVMLEDGSTLPITNWIDSLGDECDHKDAISFVFGSDETGYGAEEVGDYEASNLH